MVDETEALNRSDDAYADKKEFSDTQMELCSQCNLPKLIVNYEVGFRLLQKQLSELRDELKLLMNGIDTLEHK